MIVRIFNIWADEHFEEPIIEEKYDPDRTILKLSFKKSDDKKATIKCDDKKATINIDDYKTNTNKVKKEVRFNQILTNMEYDREYSLKEICDIVGLQSSRTKDLIKQLVQMGNIEQIGSNKNRKYKLLNKEANY